MDDAAERFSMRVADEQIVDVVVFQTLLDHAHGGLGSFSREDELGPAGDAFAGLLVKVQ